MTANYSKRIELESQAMTEAMQTAIRSLKIDPRDEGRCVQALMAAGWRAREIESLLDNVVQEFRGAR